MVVEKSGVSNQTSTLSKKLETLGVRTNNLNDYLNKEKPAEKTDGFTLSSGQTQGMFNMEPIERYQYILKQAQKNAKLDSSVTDPQKTIDQANEIINNAMLSPSLDNPDQTDYVRAIQLKHLAQGRLDIAA